MGGLAPYINEPPFNKYSSSLFLIRIFHPRLGQVDTDCRPFSSLEEILEQCAENLRPLGLPVGDANPNAVKSYIVVYRKRDWDLAMANQVLASNYPLWIPRTAPPIQRHIEFVRIKFRMNLDAILDPANQLADFGVLANPTVFPCQGGHPPMLVYGNTTMPVIPRVILERAMC